MEFMGIFPRQTGRFFLARNTFADFGDSCPAWRQSNDWFIKQGRPTDDGYV
jgi:hypothetical protein